MEVVVSVVAIAAKVVVAVAGNRQNTNTCCMVLFPLLRRYTAMCWLNADTVSGFLLHLNCSCLSWQSCIPPGPYLLLLLVHPRGRLGRHCNAVHCRLPLRRNLGRQGRQEGSEKYSISLGADQIARVGGLGTRDKSGGTGKCWSFRDWLAEKQAAGWLP